MCSLCELSVRCPNIDKVFVVRFVRSPSCSLTGHSQPVVNLEEPQDCPPEEVPHINFRTSIMQDSNALDDIYLPSSSNLQTELSTNKNILVLRNGKATTKSSSA
ncbi:hypothetical protein QE152_g19751 [Popillia japonica]|uniref:Uncharacterized protein n=1 Tax=Popillia japonica TaxID=7064 RepID=A0AAW1KRN8_POPJA